MFFVGFILGRLRDLIGCIPDCKRFLPQLPKKQLQFSGRDDQVKSIGDKCISRLMLDGGTYWFSCVKVPFLLSKVGQILGGTASQDFLLSKEELGLMWSCWERSYPFGV